MTVAGQHMIELSFEDYQDIRTALGMAAGALMAVQDERDTSSDGIGGVLAILDDAQKLLHRRVFTEVK